MEKGIHELTGLQEWTEEKWTEMRAVYYGMCSRLDYQFGLLVNSLKKHNLYDNTALFFFSDHGMYSGDYGLVDINQNTFEDALTRVPLVIKPPEWMNVAPGIRDALVELIDVPATIEEMTGLNIQHTHFGRSLLPLIAGTTDHHRDVVFCEGGRLTNESHCKELEYTQGHTDPNDLYYPRLSFQAGDGPEHTKAVMCRTDRWKYIHRLYEKHELYDLKNDPAELYNCIDDQSLAGILAEMKERMLRFFIETGDVVPFKPDKR